MLSVVQRLLFHAITSRHFKSSFLCCSYEINKHMEPGSLVTFDTHFLPEICTCSLSLSFSHFSQDFLFHQLFFYFLRLSTSSVVLQRISSYTRFPQSVHNMFPYLLSCAEIKLRDYKSSKVYGCKNVPRFDVLSICYVCMLPCQKQYKLRVVIKDASA